MQQRPGSLASTHSMTTHEGGESVSAIETLRFALRWLPYGGADSYEIFVTFGLTPAQFGHQLRSAAADREAVRATALSSDEQTRILAEARRMMRMPWPANAAESPR
ncbi:hypothetical protein OG579_13770 [Williamsia herbipolensis]|uniref:DUF3263 domain-containing protein n=1 Tax=Williamsia herbipolensis TaxID=1603258 RepID=A0AAU4JYA0_9NOCA|nr:hypothetical protein [Williamsia herbipolensis]